MQFIDLGRQYQSFKDKMNDRIQKVLDSSAYISGKEVIELEQALANYIGVKHCITCGNGTDALSLVLRAWDIKAGDAVFVPSFTFFATAEVVSACGATPIFVDVNAKTFNMDELSLEKAIMTVNEEGKLNPKVIIPVDLFGLAVNYPAILAIAKKYNLLVLSDSAQGFGGSINGKMNGSLGDAATTSFFPAKTLGCYGDGGAIFTNDDNIVKLIESLKVHGKGDTKYDNVRIGINSRLDTLQAAVLLVKLDAFKEHELEDRNRIAKKYTELLNDVVVTPSIPEGYTSSWTQYTILLKDEEERNKVKEELKKLDIPTMIYYEKPLHLQKVYEQLKTDYVDLSVSVDLSKRVLSIPMHPYLTDEEINMIAKAIKDAVKR